MGFLSGIVHSIFGGGSKTKQYPTLSPEQLKLLNKWDTYLTGQIGKGVIPYPGEIYAQSNPLYSKYFGELGDLSDLAKTTKSEYGSAISKNKSLSDYLMNLSKETINDYMNSPIRAFQQGALINALSGAPSYLITPEMTNEIYNLRVKNPAMQNWQTEIIPQIEEQYGGAGALSSSGLNRALSESGRKLQTGLSSVLGSMLENEENLNAHLYDTAAQRALASIGMASQPATDVMNLLSSISNLSTADIARLLDLEAGRWNTQQGLLSSILGGAGTMQQLQQLPLTEAYNKWGMSQPWSNPYLRYMPSAATPAYQTVMKQGSPGILGNLISAGGSILGGYLGGGGSLSNLFNWGTPSVATSGLGLNSYIPMMFP